MDSTDTQEIDEFDDIEFDLPLDQLDFSSSHFASQFPLPLDRKRSGDSDDNDDLEDELQLEFLNGILAEALPFAEQALPTETVDELALVASPIKSTSGTSLQLNEGGEGKIKDIEDIGNMIERVAPFFAFRRKGFFSVSDLVGPLWCEVQYDYRLRTLPFLPIDQRPSQIVTETGKTIQVDKKIVESHEKIMKKGNVVHKKLEREIHPEEVKVSTTTREDVWGLRFLNMLSSLEALMTLGKCRELPVVGFIKEYMIVGVIDEIVRQPIAIASQTTPTKSRPNAKGKGKAEPSTPQPKQVSLMKFLLPLPSTMPPKAKAKPAGRTHELLVSDSKTRASGTMPRPENTLGGQMQLMLYKELLDGLLQAGRPTETEVPPEPADRTSNSQAILPSSTPFSFARLFSHLGLSPSEPFSSSFLRESRAVVKGNALRHGAAEAQCLDDMVQCWTAYVERLSLGPDPRSEPFLELVYRSTGKSRVPGEKKDKKRRKVEVQPKAVTEDDEERQLQRAIEESLMHSAPPALASPELMSLSQVSKASTDLQYWAGTQQRSQSEEREEEELAVAVERSMAQMMREGSVAIEEQVVVMSEAISADFPTALVMDAPGTPERSQGVAVVVDGPAETQMNALSDSSKDTVPLPPASTDDQPSTSPLPTFIPVSAIYKGEERKVASTRASVANLTSPTATSARLDEPHDVFTVSDGEASPPTTIQVTDEASVEQVQDEVLMRSGPEPSATVTRRSKRLMEAASSPASNQSIEQSQTQSQQTQSQPSAPTPAIPIMDQESSKASGSIIGKHRFRHAPEALAAHLNSVLAFWIGERAPVGVKIEDTSRCGWCEFEEGCEWRAKKAEEAMMAARAARARASHLP